MLASVSLVVALTMPVGGCQKGLGNGPKPKAVDLCPILNEIEWEESDADVVSEKLLTSLDMITELEEDEGCNDTSQRKGKS
ncbi:hypothetical protein [Pseudovibrio sp. Ad37]|uniref:hypothetical protein n=1 Tax=Pseudovibrio sp. Ad37 TaxID=989422 RepID=UPI0007AED4D6|nr:hypothetical protein [Pseudovibrio sp. Ad37]KZL22722.1 hypothetical protein PsAD37_03281 [Pseudovibrio sp. Ad37]